MTSGLLYVGVALAIVSVSYLWARSGGDEGGAGGARARGGGGRPARGDAVQAGATASRAKRTKAKVTIGGLRVFLTASGGKYALLDGVVDRLNELAQAFDVYLITVCHSDEAEQEIMAALDAAKLFVPGGLSRDKVLYCETVPGKAHIARHIDPKVHIDADVESLRLLQPHIPSVFFVNAQAVADGPDAVASAITTVSPSAGRKNVKVCGSLNGATLA